MRVCVALLSLCRVSQFDITVHKVYGTKPAFSYIVKWSRGVKVASTKAVPSTKETAGKAGLTIDQKMSLMVTLYREEGKKFDPKDAKISLVAVNPARKQERTTAKMHFDLSAFAGVPSASTTKVFKLSDKFSIRATIDARFVKTGASGPGSAGASSALSGMSGVSGRSSDDDDADDDFDDLALDDVPEPEVFGASSAKSRRAPPLNKTPSSVTQSKAPVIAETPKTTTSSATSERRKPPTPPPPSNPTTPATPPTPSPCAPAQVVTPSPPAPPASSSPKRGQSPLSRFRRDKSVPVAAVVESKAVERPRLGDEANIAKLSQENERLSSDLRRAREESRSLRDSHRGDIEKLNSQLEVQTREVSASASQRASSDASLSELRVKSKDMEDKIKALTDELEVVKKSRDSLASKNKALSAIEEKNRELSHEVDRLTIAASSSGSSNTDSTTNGSEVEKRLIQVRQEKETVEKKLKAHESHSAKVRSTYQKLSQMYNDLRDHNAALQSELDDNKAKADKQSVSDADEDEELLAQLDDARQDILDIEADKEALQSDHDRLLSQVNSLQDRLDNTTQLLEESQREAEDLFAETEELKGQRDMAMQRALSRGKSGAGSDTTSTRSIGKVEEDLRISREKYEREQARLTRRTAELEQIVADLREDIEYEKAEKNKARAERDNFRNNARALERKTSQAAKQSDAMHSLKRQISTHQMRAQDHESMVTDLKAEVERLESELYEARSTFRSRESSNADEIGEVLQDLVSTKLALAQAEDDKLNLQFSMKKLKKNEKGIQQRLAGHASRLEVKLGEANEELERLRKQQRLEDATEFNDLGSDVDY